MAQTRDATGSGHETRTTTDHETIRQWAEVRCARPSAVKGTAKEGESVGILRLDFPGFRGMESLQEITWEEFFQKFDEEKLAFLYQEQSEDGQESRFCKFIHRDS